MTNSDVLLLMLHWGAPRRDVTVRRRVSDFHRLHSNFLPYPLSNFTVFA